MLNIELCGVKFKNPVFLASGIMGSTGKSLLKMAKCGAGAVTTKSISLNEREGHKNPTIVELDDSLLNAIGLCSPGVDEFLEEIKEIKSYLNKMNTKLIVSIFGENEEEFKEIAKKVEHLADIIELNISCPHAKGVNKIIGQNPDLTYSICKEVKKSVKVPVFVKLTPNVTDVIEIASAANDAKIDGFTAINTVRGLAIDIKAKKPILANKFGGLSGKAIKPIGLRVVYELYENFNKPIIGVGGIFSGYDAIEYFLAGASAVQVGTAVLKDYEIFKKINKEIEEYLLEENLTLKDIVGLAHE
ncbi:dihydroorotate dehydrogenase [Methanocaldococcus indicus]|uniref:dihydroorotate dehydrogenase n=1 Tax=Methanocaldococcus indicus TaxID=213231 RepID=UPI003C6D2E68